MVGDWHCYEEVHDKLNSLLLTADSSSGTSAEESASGGADQELDGILQHDSLQRSALASDQFHRPDNRELCPHIPDCETDISDVHTRLGCRYQRTDHLDLPQECHNVGRDRWSAHRLDDWYLDSCRTRSNWYYAGSGIIQVTLVDEEAFYNNGHVISSDVRRVCWSPASFLVSGEGRRFSPL